MMGTDDSASSNGVEGGTETNNEDEDDEERGTLDKLVDVVLELLSLF